MGWPLTEFTVAEKLESFRYVEVILVRTLYSVVYQYCACYERVRDKADRVFIKAGGADIRDTKTKYYT